MISKKKIEELIDKHSLLEKDLSAENIEKKEFAEKSKEYSGINEIIESVKKYLSFDDNKKDLEKILEDKNSDDELKKLAEIELKDLKNEHEHNEKIKYFFYQKMKQIKKMLLLKLEQAQVASKQVCLPLIYLKCTKK